MARKEQIARRKQELINQMADSREAIDQGRTAIKEKLNVKRQISSLIRSKPKVAFAGAAVAGLLGTSILRRPRKATTKKKKTLSNLITGGAMLFIKPAAKKWLKNSLKTYAVNKLSSLTQRQQPQSVEAQHKVRDQIH